MKFYIQTLNDNGSGMKYDTKEECLKEIGLMIDDCIANGGTFISFDVDSDASCFYISEDDEEEEIAERNKELDVFSMSVKDKRRGCPYGYWLTNEGVKLNIDDVNQMKDFGGYCCELKESYVTPHECSKCENLSMEVM